MQGTISQVRRPVKRNWPLVPKKSSRFQQNLILRIHTKPAYSSINAEICRLCFWRVSKSVDIHRPEAWFCRVFTRLQWEKTETRLAFYVISDSLNGDRRGHQPLLLCYIIQQSNLLLRRALQLPKIRQRKFGVDFRYMPREFLAALRIIYKYADRCIFSQRLTFLRIASPPESYLMHRSFIPSACHISESKRLMLSFPHNHQMAAVLVEPLRQRKVALEALKLIFGD